MQPLRNLYFDPIVLAYIGDHSFAAQCLRPIFEALKQGRCDLIPTHVSPNIFAVEACGLRLYIAYSRDRSRAEITGYTHLSEADL